MRDAIENAEGDPDRNRPAPARAISRVAVLRPQPGNRATCERLTDAGYEAIALPLFAIRLLPWRAPDPAAFDALLLTSANAVRAAGDELARLAHLPVVAVGTATARAAAVAGLSVVAVGESDGAAAVRGASGRLLHLAGRDHVALVPDAIAVYAAEPLPMSADALRPLAGSVALLHSVRAATRLAELLPASDRATVRLAALSPRVAVAAGEGWAGCAVASAPRDAALIDAVRTIDR